ncbi:replication protein A 14 kDa subunit-like [Penaeus chinensis]|uniref:replication protein A 14 kDa subunit-like n=1 Tax=Penaeus chinensis TaxID=139456 RepID=UPI001FB6373A|nr:replication protein A 14 kDa subunit-like [Penaeus chinensis]
MVSAADEPRMRVNGATLAQHNGRPVVLMGQVEKIDPSGIMVMVKASDGQSVQVKLQEPLQENLEGLIEIHGFWSRSSSYVPELCVLPHGICQQF